MPFAGTSAVPSALGAGPVARCEPLCLVLDREGNLGECGRVLPVVVCAEQQVLAAMEKDADVGLSATAVAAVHGVYRLGAGRNSAGRHFLALLSLGPALGP